MKTSIVIVVLICTLCRIPSLMAQEILSGAGATFPGPFYGRVIAEYQKRSPTRVDYQQVGSGAGIRMLLDQKVDFGASDIFLYDDDLEDVAAPVVHIPTCIGAVAIITNLPGKPMLELDADGLAGLLMGKIKRWGDDRIVAKKRPPAWGDLEVTVVHRADSSGTTFILTDYLTKTSPSWQAAVGRGKRVKWLSGMGVQGNGGVSDMVARIPGSIGYVSLNYAQQKKLAVAAIKNRSGRYILPSPKTASIAAAIDLPEDGRVLITDTAAKEGYPISAFTYILVYREQAYGHRTRQKADALIDFLRWVVTDGQAHASSLHYAPLPENAVRCALRAIDAITFGGGR